jgi:hypothetical protein
MPVEPISDRATNGMPIRKQGGSHISASPNVCAHFMRLLFITVGGCEPLCLVHVSEYVMSRSSCGEFEDWQADIPEQH